MTLPSRAAVCIAALVCGCRAPSAPSAPVRTTDAAMTWVVIAPHPDDEALIAGGVLAREVARGHRVAVIVVTNGDADCVHDGSMREGETIAGLARLGVPESAVRFLGYPDGALARLGSAPLSVRRRTRGGACELGQTTYGDRGADRADYHRARTGAPAPYTREAVVDDLARLLAELDPTDVAITHPEDAHPDHAATYTLFRDALDRLARAPRVHRAIVHNGDCWPSGSKTREPCPPTFIVPNRPTPPLSGRLTGYAPRERLPVPPALLLPDPATNPKLLAIAAHRSQTRGTLESYLFDYARSDEVFFPEAFAREGSSWVRRGAVALAASRARLPRADARLVAAGEGAYGYAAEIDAARLEARLVRRGPAEDVLLHVAPLPHDLWSTGAEEDFELRVDDVPEDHVNEVSLRCRGSLAAVAVDLVTASPSARREP